MTKEIEVNRRAWHARVYLWWYYTKWPHRRSEGPKTASNLCPYVRAVVLWAPLRWLFYQGRIGKVQLRVAWVAWRVFLVSIPQPLGYISYNLKRALWISDAILGAAAVIIGLCFVVVYIAEWADQKWYWASRLETWKIDRRHRAEVRLYRELTKKKKKGPSIWKLIGEYMLAAHDRVCPEIVFKGDSELEGQ